MRSDKALLKRFTSADVVSAKEEQLQIEMEERSRLQKLTHRFVERSVRSLLGQEAIEERKGAHFVLGKDLQTRFGEISLDPFELHGLYSSILQNIREIDQLTKQRSAAVEAGAQVIRKPQLRPTIYIASTCYDFRDLRQEVKQALRDWGYKPILNEDSVFPVEAGVDSYTACIEAVRQSDCLVLIVGTRYGGEVPGKGVSITELEYETARNAGIPRINFCLDSVWNLIQFRKINPNARYPEYFCEDKRKIDKIFEFLDRVRKYEEHKPNNWVHVFRNSVELKEILRRRLRRIFPQDLQKNRPA